MRPELLKQTRVSENFRANLFVQFVEFRQKLVADFNNPWHDVLCTVRHYSVNCICSAEAVDLCRRQTKPQPGLRPRFRRTWRQVLFAYNNDTRNPFGLYPAYRLYADNVYRRLANRFAVQNLYILSAGWGLIRADFLTPYYDITFSQTRKDQRYKRRRESNTTTTSRCCQPLQANQSYFSAAEPT